MIMGHSWDGRWAMGFGSVPVRSMTDLELYFPSFRDSRAVVYGREWSSMAGRLIGLGGRGARQTKPR